jgi:hypothetical protein
LVVDWRGEAADALRTDTHADLMTTSRVSDHLQSAATVARSGASELETARSRVQYAVDDARSAGFEVGEDLSVTDRMGGGSAAQLAARQAAAQAFAGDIGARATQLVALDAQVAGRITAAVAGVANTFPQVPAQPAPTRAAPAESVPVEGFDSGGPAGIPPWPHLVHPPGTIDHGIPIIGEDDPGEDLRDFRH